MDNRWLVLNIEGGPKNIEVCSIRIGIKSSKSEIRRWASSLEESLMKEFGYSKSKMKDECSMGYGQ